MPYKPKTICTIISCNEFAIKYGLCNKHIKEKYQTQNQTRDKNITHLYSSPSWDRLREQHLRKQPFCIQCKSVILLQVDHIKPHQGNPLLFYGESNLQTLCKSCHSRKTMKEINA